MTLTSPTDTVTTGNNSCASVNFFHVVGPSYPCDFDTRKLAYFYWLWSGQLEGKSEEFWLLAEKDLTYLINADFHAYDIFINDLRAL